MALLPDLLSWARDLEAPVRIALVAGVAALAHLAVRGVRRGTLALLAASGDRAHPKIRTAITLADSTLVFALYFLAIGFVLMELGIPLGAYLASASIVGLAVGFGAQGLVQDVVTGLTLVFADLIGVGDMVEVSGQIGRVRRVGMRFVVLRSYTGASVYVPNRTITAVVKYPRGYVRAIVDVRLPAEPARHDEAEELVRRRIESFEQRFAAILLRETTVAGRLAAPDGAVGLRVKLRIWPGQGGPIENVLRREIVEALRAVDPAAGDWMVSVGYEIEKRVAGRGPRS